MRIQSPKETNHEIKTNIFTCFFHEIKTNIFTWFFNIKLKFLIKNFFFLSFMNTISEAAVCRCSSKLVLLKAHRQISKNWCFEKHFSCDQACQFLALEGTPWRSYLENLTIDDKFINKWVRLCIHQTMCREEKSISSYVKTRLRNTCLIVLFFKKIQKQPSEVFC